MKNKITSHLVFISITTWYAALVLIDGFTAYIYPNNMSIKTEVKIIINSSLRAGKCHLRVSQLSEGSQSRVAMSSNIPFMQRDGEQYLRVLWLTDVGQDHVKTRPRSDVPNNAAPERLYEEGSEVNLCHKLSTSTTTFYISSDAMYNYYNTKMLVKVEFLICTDQTVPSLAEMSPQCMILFNFMKEAEVFQKKSKEKEELRWVGYI